MAKRKTNVVRFAVGRADGARSASWRVWVEKDGSIYVGARGVSDRLKASLHSSGKWRVGYGDLDDAKATALGFPPTARALDKFAPPPEIVPGLLRRAFTVYIPWQAIGAPSNGRVEQQTEIVWLPELAGGHVAEYSVYIAAPQMVMGPNVVGRLLLPNGDIVWVLNRVRPILPTECADWFTFLASEETGDKLLATATPDRRLIRQGSLSDGSRYFADIRFHGTPGGIG